MVKTSAGCKGEETELALVSKPDFLKLVVVCLLLSCPLSLASVLAEGSARVAAAADGLLLGLRSLRKGE